MAAGDILRSADMAAVAELSYIDPAGVPRAVSLVPLRLDNDVCFALPYSRAGLAQEIGRSPRALVSFTDSRLAYKGWQALAVSGSSKVFPDPDGELFIEKLLEQELRKHPPSRRLIDTFVMRRDYWWYVPRLIVRFSPQGRARELTRRQSPGSALLIWTLRSNLDLDVVEVDDWEGARVAVRSLTGRDIDAASGEALLFFHNFEVPERDRVAEYSAWGRLERGAVKVSSRGGTRDLGPPATLRERMRSLRELERLCRAGLRGAGSH
jgi:hypothetical protein